MCVCVSVSAPKLLITSGVMWCDIDSIQLAAVVGIVSGRDVSIHTRHGN